MAGGFLHATHTQDWGFSAEKKQPRWDLKGLKPEATGLTLCSPRHRRAEQIKITQLPQLEFRGDSRMVLGVLGENCINGGKYTYAGGWWEGATPPRSPASMQPVSGQWLWGEVVLKVMVA